MAALLVHSQPCCTSMLAVDPVPGRRRRLCRQGEARIVCIGGGRSEREAAAKKALEQALGGKKEVFSKWDEEIKMRESRGGGGGGRKGGGRGGGGGGGGGIPDPQDQNSWNEAKQIFFAFTGLLGFYLLVTNGKKSLAFVINLPKYMMIGGTKVLAFLINFPFLLLRGFRQRPKRQLASTPDLSDSPSSSSSPESAEAHVVSKWGRD